MEYIVSNRQGFEVVLKEDFQEEDIISLLKFDETEIEDLLKRHAAIQAYWEALAIRYKNRYESFKEDWSRKWWAYNKGYAKHVLAAYGDSKPTVEAIKDTTILIYTNEITDQERLKYATLAYDAASKNKAFFEGSQEEFFNAMYKYIRMEVPWYFETLVSTLNKLKEDSELVDSIADKLNSRSFHMQDLLKLLTAKQYNIGPSSYTDGDTAKEVMRIKRRQNG
jgi:hypothetical protein